MKLITDKEFTEFLAQKPLYSKIKAVSNFVKSDRNFSNPLDYNDKKFRFKCPKENEVHTFKTELHNRPSMYGRSLTNLVSDHEIPDYFSEKTKYLDLSIPLFGTCQSCNTKIDFLLKVYSDKSWDNHEKGINIFIQKIGQHPAYSIEPEKEVYKYLSIEDNENYKKALINLSVSYGIGAYAYFRRIIENEIKRIIKDISSLDFDGADKIRTALDTFEKDHQMSNLINVLNNFLPKSLTELGDNPIKLLYEQLSGGIHTFTDEECLEKAELINVVLSYVIKKVNEEKYQISNVKSAMLKLRNGY